MAMMNTYVENDILENEQQTTKTVTITAKKKIPTNSRMSLQQFPFVLK